MCKKDLTRDPVAGIMARACFFKSSSYYYWRKTCLILKNLVHTRKKDLTFLAFALILARATPIYIIVVLLLAPPRQKSRKIKRFCRECFTWNIPESGFAKIARFPFAYRCSPQRANPPRLPFLLIASCGHNRKARFRHFRKISNM